MKLKKSEKILTSAAGGAVLIFILNQAVCNKKAPPPVQVSQQAETIAEGANPPPSKTAKEPRSVAAKKRKRATRPKVEFKSWGRDPFAETFRLVKFDLTEADSSNFVLRGVIRRGNQAYVLIGDDILRAGEQRGDLTVVSIEENRVVCKKKGRMVTLILNQEDGT